MSGFNYSSAVNYYTSCISLALTQNQLLRFSNAWDVTTSVPGNHVTGHDYVTANPAHQYAITIQTPSGLRYNHHFGEDSKSLITFECAETGTYQLQMYRVYNASDTVSNGFAFSVQDPISTTP